MTPSLLSLSEELLVRIVSFTEYGSLTSLALVSRTLNRLVIPEMYASVEFKGASSDTGVQFLIPLTFHLLKNPDIAGFVRTFSIRDQFGSDEEDLAPLNSDEEAADDGYRKGWPSSPDLDALLRQAVEDVEEGGEEKEKLFKTVRNGSSESAILSILLPKLPNLRKLDLVQGFMSSNPEFSRLLPRIAKREAPFDKKPALTKLAEVLVAGCDDKYPNSPDLLGAYLELPSIRLIHAFQLGANEQDSVTPSMAVLGTGTSPVEELELRGSQLYTEDFDRVLKACRNLKTLIYEAGHAWAWYPLRTGDIMTSMKYVKDTLETLLFDHSDYVDESGDDDLSPVSLADFKMLRYLNISSMFLTGIDKSRDIDLSRTFPPSLETLHLTHVVDEVFWVPKFPAAFQQIIEKKELVFPVLTKLTLEGSFVNDPDRLDGIKQLVQTARAKGIETAIWTNEDRDTHDWDDRIERGWGIDETFEWNECFGNQVGEMNDVDVEALGW